MNRHALAALAFGDVLDLVAARASSPLAAARLRAAEPATDRAWIEREHAGIAALRALITSDGGYAPAPIPDLAGALRTLRAAGSRLTGPELVGAALLLRSARLTRAALRDDSRPAMARAVLAPLALRLDVGPANDESAAGLRTAAALEGTLGRALDAEGLVLDAASPALGRLRRELRGAEGDLIRLLERAMARLEAHQRVPDMSVTMRNGRYVIPIRREARGPVGGIVHDESATGGTLFVEPPAAVEAGNRIRELEQEERRETERILGELTDTLRPLQGSLNEALDALITLDTIYARARFALDLRCAPVALASPAEGVRLRGARHPLLAAAGGAVVPFDLTLHDGSRTLLVSGPNTGGKTVLIEAVGLAAVLTQAGIPAPVGPESHLPIFDDILADIGDEQSIAASLSTFSAHLRHLAEILDGATADTLVLIDELGSGTDPAEGAALGGAILEELTRRGTCTLATTHLGALKLLATEVDGIVNASLQFDAQALAPTYRLVQGIPGRSYGLAIARRLALPRGVLARAEERLSTGERDVAALLAELERRDRALAERNEEIDTTARTLAARAADVEQREQAAREAERALERAGRREARQFLLDARAEVETVIRGLRDNATADRIREARRALEARASEHAGALEHLDAGAPAAGEGAGDRPPGVLPASAAPPAPDDLVEVASLGGRTGRVLSVRGDEAVVALGAVKLSVPLVALRRARRAAVVAEPVPLRGEAPEERIATEVDVRGLRADEAEREVVQALDDAVRADLASLRIIHGKGTGALRERVGEILRGDRRVRAFRAGAWNEGGTGVTVADLRVRA